MGGWWVVRASRTCNPKPNGRNWRTRAANAVRRVLGDMGQGGAGERAGRCCVRGDRRTRAVYGDDARESPADEAHGECGARGHAARPRERCSAPLILGSVARGVGIPGFPIVQPYSVAVSRFRIAPGSVLSSCVVFWQGPRILGVTLFPGSDTFPRTVTIS